MHPMFYRQPFAILRHNLQAMRADGLPPQITALKARFAAMSDKELLAAWGALHDPFRLDDRVLH